MAKGDSLRYRVSVVREFLQDRLVHLIREHGRLAVAWMGDDLDELLLVDLRVQEPLLDALHGVGEDVCSLWIKRKIVAFEVQEVDLMEKPLRPRQLRYATLF